MRSDAPLALRSPVPMSLPEGVGPITAVQYIDGQPVDDEQDVMPGLRADVVTMARDMWVAWDLGTPGRVPKRQRTVHPADQMAIAWRTVVGNPSARPRAQTSASARSGTQVAAVEPEEEDSVVGIQGWTPPEQQGGTICAALKWLRSIGGQHYERHGGQSTLAS